MAIDVRALVAALPEDLVLELTARMVAIPTRNPPGEERPCAGLIHETLRGWGLEAALTPREPPVYDPDSRK